ncbi:MAG: hypothetical protein PF692_08240 [Kiritimatiellae bacterium]|jgi:hypothetical protein|nr:hypothetical protein [Kiritimatiellia bacterium]
MIRILRLMLLLLLATTSLQATTRYWNGSVNNLYTNGLNWVGGVAPANGDYTDLIYFNDTKLSGLMIKESELTSNRSIREVVFEDAGYSLSGNQILARKVLSYGTGTNSINALKFIYNYNCNSYPGNTLNIIQSVYIDGGNTIKFAGGGTIVFNNSFGGWGTSYQEIYDALVVFKKSQVSTKTYFTKLMQTESELQLKTTVSSAESLISAGTITDNLGQGLTVTDIGGGYVSIKIAPPKIPGTVFIVK